MADTQSRQAGPAMETEPAEPRMSATEALDVLDEFHIKRSDMQRVYTALETMLEPDETSTPEVPQAADAQMMDQVFARKPTKSA